MEKLDYWLISTCLIGRQVEIKEDIEFYKMNCERFELSLDTYKTQILKCETELARIEKELEKIKQIRLNLYLEN